MTWRVVSYLLQIGGTTLLASWSSSGAWWWCAAFLWWVSFGVLRWFTVDSRDWGP